jgi:hypothetical protein
LAARKVEVQVSAGLSRFAGRSWFRRPSGFPNDLQNALASGLFVVKVILCFSLPTAAVFPFQPEQTNNL